MNQTTKRLLTSAAAITLGIALQLQTGCTYYVQSTPDQTNQPQPAPIADYSDTQDIQPEPYQPPPQDVAVVYQDNLSPYGSWVDVSGYGSCWTPANQPDDWQPYTVGHWEYTDYGWTWVAEGPEAQWGPICYHYGRWYRDPSHGWCWIPGVTWAPAWVAWREGGGYCGWAPLPPQCGFGPTVNVTLVNRYVAANQFVYCDERFVNAPQVNQHFVRNNVTIINQTTNITNITYQNNVVINYGIPINNVQRATGRPVEKVQLTQATTPEQARSLAAAGKPVLFAPPAVRQAEQQRAQRAETNFRNPTKASPEKPTNPNAQFHQPSPPSVQPQQPTPPPNEDQQRAADEQKQKAQQAAEEKARQEQEQAQQQEQQKQQQAQQQQDQQRQHAQQQQEQDHAQQQPQQQQPQQKQPPQKDQDRQQQEQQQKQQQQDQQQKQQQQEQQQKQQQQQQPKQKEPPKPPPQQPKQPPQQQQNQQQQNQQKSN
jgi:DNA segregation ATPase FtsK/SpoIIIE-like protein